MIRTAVRTSRMCPRRTGPGTGMPYAHLANEACHHAGHPVTADVLGEEQTDRTPATPLPRTAFGPPTTPAC
jgi:hypothetical protein